MFLARRWALSFFRKKKQKLSVAYFSFTESALATSAIRKIRDRKLDKLRLQLLSLARN